MLTHEQRVALRTADPMLNVRDEFRGLTAEEVRSMLATRRTGLMLGFVNTLRDFNFSGIIRACNAFCCSGIYYTGFRRFDPRGAVGTNKYENIYHCTSIGDPVEDMLALIKTLRAEDYRIVVAESDEYVNSVALHNYAWQEKTFLILGEESIGVPQEVISIADDVVYIKQFGSVRSLNVASAGHIFIYDYMAKTGKL